MSKCALWLIPLAMVMILALAGCDKSSPSNSSSGSESLRGTLQYENLEGGLWRITSKEQSYVLRSDVAGKSLEQLIEEGKVKSGDEVVVFGRPASDEENIGIHQAGPYYELHEICKYWPER